MDDQNALRIVSADRLEDSIIIGFSDGRIGLYSTELLHGALAQSKELFESDTADECDEPDELACSLP